MKLLLFATTALATSPLLSSRSTNGEQLASGFVDIKDKVQNLIDQVKSAQGPEQANALISASNNIVDAIKAVSAKVKSGGPLDDFDTLSLGDPVLSLREVTREAVEALLGKKQLIVDSGRGCEVLPRLEAQKAQTKALIDDIFEKIPDELRSVADALTPGILNGLEKGIEAFKDVVCAAASSTATSAAAASTTPAPTTTTVPTPVEDDDESTASYTDRPWPVESTGGSDSDSDSGVEETPVAEPHPLTPTAATAIQTAHPAAANKNGTKPYPNKLDKETETDEPEDSDDAAVSFPKGPSASYKSPYATAGLKPSSSRDYPGYVPRPSGYIPSSSSSSSSSSSFGGKNGEKNADNEPITPPIITSGGSQGNNACFGIAFAAIFAAVAMAAAM